LIRLLLFIVNFILIYSQNRILDFNQLSQKDGLSDATITAITEDGIGYLWVGTESGLNRYDGKEFQTYYPNPTDSNSLKDSYIQYLYTDISGRLWIGTLNGGLYYYNNKKNEVSQFHFYKGEKKPERINDIHCILEDKKRNLWIADHNSLYKYSMHERKILKIFNGNKFFQIKTMYLDSTENLWLGKRYGLTYLNTKSNLSKRIEKIHNSVYKIYNENGISVVTESGIYKQTTKYFKQVLKKPLRFAFISNKRLYLIERSERENKLYEAVNGKLENIFIRNDQIKKDGIISSYTSKSNILYLGSKTNGLFSSSEMRSYIKYIPTVTQNTKTLFLTSNGKLVFQDRSLSTIDKKDWDSENFINTDIKLPLKSFIATRKDSNTFFLLNSQGDIYQVNNNLQKIWEYKSLPINDSKPVSDIVYINNQLIVSRNDGAVFQFDLTTKIYKKIYFPKRLMIYDIHPSQDNQLWFGTNYGLYQLNKANNKIKHYKQTENLHITQILAEKNDSILWLGTETQGLKQYTNINKNYIETGSYQFPSNKIYSMEFGYNKHIWLTTKSSIFNVLIYRSKPWQYNVMKIRNYSNNNLNTIFNFNASSSYQDYIFFRAMNKIVYFNSRKILSSRNMSKVKIVISEFRVFNKEYSWNIQKNEEISLGNKQHSFSFHFAALDFLDPKKNQYAYKLEPFETNWNYIGNNNTASYTNIPPGEYTFRIKASNNSEVWNEKGFSVKITIEPPLYMKAWLHIMLSILSFIILFFSYKARTRKLRNDKIQLEKIVADRTQELEEKTLKLSEMDKAKSNFFTNVSHEFRTPLSLIIAPLQELLSIKKKPESEKDKLKYIEKNANKLLDLTNELLEVAKIESGSIKLNLEVDCFSEFIQRIIDFYKPEAIRKSIHLSSNIEKDDINSLFDSSKLNRALSNIISNALKHCKMDESITILLKKQKFTTEMTNYEIIIRDTGEGIEKEDLPYIFDRFYQGKNSSEGTGIGLSLCKVLIDHHGGNISVYSEVNKFTEFTIHLSLQKALHQNIFVKENLSINQDKINNNNTNTEQDVQIILVEDNDDLRNYIQSVLSPLYGILTFPDANKGFEAATKEIPDIIITDIMMPNMTGIEFAKKLKNDDRTSHIPIVFLTAKASERDRFEGYLSGGDFYLTKPFYPEQLSVIIRNVLEKRIKQQHYFLKEKGFDIKEETDGKNLDFQKKLIQIIKEKLSDPHFDVSRLSEEIGMSQSNLYRKVKAITGKSTIQLINYFRLEKAAKLIKNGQISINEVSYNCGFENVNHFRRSFKEKYKVNPSEYQSK
jgi:signal transduction histidine kinase/ligand-binding sensor domain-containing protein/DNA-binding response OmpR family regulator